MRKSTLAILTGIMIFSLSACGDNTDSVIIQAGDSNNDSKQNISTEINVEDTEVKEKDNTEESEPTETTETTEQKENTVETEDFSILGVWSTDKGDIYTFDNGEFSKYESDKNTYTYGTYETDTELNITISIKQEEKSKDTTNSKKKDKEFDEEKQLENTTKTIDKKYSMEYSLKTNEYNQEFVVVTLKSSDEAIKLTKNYSIKEKSNKELQEELEDTVEEEEVQEQEEQ